MHKHNWHIATYHKHLNNHATVLSAMYIHTKIFTFHKKLQYQH